MKRGKKAISPVIATILLVAIVVVLALIFFFWYKQWGREAITKDNRAIELVCADVVFNAEYSSGALSVSNQGNIPIYNFRIKKIKPGSSQITDVATLDSNWPSEGLNPASAHTSPITISQEYKKILVIPILLGDASSGKKAYVCDESYGIEISTA